MGPILQFTNLRHTSTQKLQFSNEFLDIFVLEFHILPDFSKTKILHENQSLSSLIVHQRVSPFKIRELQFFTFVLELHSFLEGSKL